LDDAMVFLKLVMPLMGMIAIQGFIILAVLFWHLNISFFDLSTLGFWHFWTIKDAPTT